MLAGVDGTAVVENTERGHGGTNIDNRHGQLIATTTQLVNQQPVGSFQGIRLDINHFGSETSKRKSSLANLDVFFSAGGKQDLNSIGIARGCALHFEIDGNFF